MVRLDDDLKSNTTRIPEKLLNQVLINNYENKDNDDRFGKKRKKGQSVSRKDKRKQERALKKQKRSKSDSNGVFNGLNKSNLKNSKLRNDKSKFRDEEVQEDLEQDPMHALQKLQAGKIKNMSEVRLVREDDLQDDSVSDLEESDSQDPIEALKKLKGGKNNNNSDLRVIKEDDLNDDEFSDFSDFNEEEEYSQDPMEALRKLKEGKDNKSSKVRIIKEDDIEDEDVSESDDSNDELEDPMEALSKLKQNKKNSSGFRIVKEDDLSDYDSSNSNVNGGDDFYDFEEDENTVSPPQDQNLFKQDDDDIEYYAKKLGLKDGKKSKLSKIDDDDVIGGLLDGLDLDFSDSEQENYSDPEQNDSDSEQKTLKSNSFAKDDEEIDYYARKLGLKNGKNSKLSKLDENDEIGGLLEGLDFDGEEETEHSDIESDNESNPDSDETSKENPYVAPGIDAIKNDEEQKIQKYIPPALRRQLAMENETSQETIQLRKSIKGPLNKLSEANIGTIVNEIQTLYMSHPRQILNEEITAIILDSIIQQGRLLDTFVYLHATVVVALYRLQGMDFGAYFIQHLIENFEKFNQESSKTKESSNLSSLLSSLYTFQLISSKLLYDLIKQLINNLNENNADILLRLIRNSGNQMRSDDPSSLKDIILFMNEKFANLPKELNNTRIQFLIETITSLKNNKLKIINEANHQLSIRLKKFLGGINNNKFGDPIQVNLDDIHNVSSKGKWWLVGSAWKGNDDQEVKDVDSTAVNDILDSAEPNWMELAKAQRMNTDIRRAIFVSIMSANDYIESITKLDKLSLKRSQEREIPRVLTHCATMEPSYNPYYGILANKLCESHSLRKTFQFMLWDLIKELDGISEDNQFDDDDDESKLGKILNLGRFYGYLLAEGSIPLHNLRTINFLTASSDTQLFLEVAFVSFFDQVGKKSKKNSVGVGLKSLKGDMADVKFDDRILVEKVIKAKDQSTLLRGLQYFLQEKVKSSDVISGKKQSTRVQWGVDAMFDIIDEILKDAA